MPEPRYLNPPSVANGSTERDAAAELVSSLQEHTWCVQDGGAFKYWPAFQAQVGNDGMPRRDKCNDALAVEPGNEVAAIKPGLQCQDDSQGSVDVLPEGGTVVLFDSRRLRHAVCPSHRRRVALSAWFVSAATVVDGCEH